MFADVYRGRRVLVTGHTGFKGSWLCLWLQQLGAQVTGYSLGLPTEPSHFEMLGLEGVDDRRGDIRDLAALKKVMAEVQPEVVFHMAAQPIVRLSYSDPVETFGINVMGTVTLLEACRGVASIEAIVNITSDKCYENVGKIEGYLEHEPMGGHDPYSASKGCAELVAASYRRAFADLAPLASVRAGNVIGGGDWAADRLIPDAARAMRDGKTLVIRRPDAVRPWQHVLEPLSGYLTVGQKLLEKAEVAEGWNFGPTTESTLTVEQVLQKLRDYMPLDYECVREEKMLHEATLLTLDSGKAEDRLGWRGTWDAAEMLRQTAAWYEAYVKRGEVITRQQLDTYVADAVAKGLAWAS